MALQDKKGKEVYFVEDPTERTFEAGMVDKFTNPSWTIKTDDWGYIYRAFEKTLSNSNSYWKDYDIFLAVALTAGVTSILWVIGCSIEINKYVKANWNATSAVRLGY